MVLYSYRVSVIIATVTNTHKSDILLWSIQTAQSFWLPNRTIIVSLCGYNHVLVYIYIYIDCILLWTSGTVRAHRPPHFFTHWRLSGDWLPFYSPASTIIITRRSIVYVYQSICISENRHRNIVRHIGKLNM